MSLIEKVVKDKNSAKIAAMKAKKVGKLDEASNSTIEATVLGVLQGEYELESTKMVKAEIDGEEKEVMREPMTDDDLIALATKLIKSNNKVLKMGENPQLTLENEVLTRYLPKADVLSEAETQELIKAEIDKLSKEVRESKGVMGIVMKAVRAIDKIDKGLAAKLTKQMLS